MLRWSDKDYKLALDLLNFQWYNQGIRPSGRLGIDLKSIFQLQLIYQLQMIYPVTIWKILFLIKFGALSSDVRQNMKKESDWPCTPIIST
jgi:hypothetical protein